VEVVARKTKPGKNAVPEQKLCNHLAPAIHTDGMDKGRLVKICANPDCKIHFGNRAQEEKQRLQWKAEKQQANRKAKQTLALRHRLLAEVLKRVKPPLSNDALRLVAQFILRSLSHDLACRLAKRHGLQPSTKDQDWELAEKARALHKSVQGAALAALIFEAMLLGSVGNTTETKDDSLTDAATLYKVDAKSMRRTIVKEEKEKERRKTAKRTKGKDTSKAKAIAK
jgi:ParB family chromosome partitioning protein